jgi:hypothetical protein
VHYQDITLLGVFTFEFTEEVIENRGLYTLSLEELKNIIEIKMIPGEEQDPSKNGITNYYITEMSGKNLKIQVIFENPIYISTGETPDTF